MNLDELIKTAFKGERPSHNGIECLRVLVFRRPNFRDDMVEMFLHAGRPYLDRVMDGPAYGLDLPEEVTLMYPERWLNSAEEQVLIDRLDKHTPGLKAVNIVTHGHVLLTTIPSKCIRIVCQEGENVRDIITSPRGGNAGLVVC